MKRVAKIIRNIKSGKPLWSGINTEISVGGIVLQKLRQVSDRFLLLNRNKQAAYFGTTSSHSGIDVINSGFTFPHYEKFASDITNHLKTNFSGRGNGIYFKTNDTRKNRKHKN